MSATILAVERLIAGYIPDLPIVKEVSIEVRAGEIVTIIGPNGAGKSTLLKAIAGLVRTSGGSVRLHGRELLGVPTHQLAHARIAYVPQTANIFTTLTIHENMRVGGHILGRELGQRLERAYALFPEIAARRSAKGRVLSGGQRQMLAIARALLVDPVMIMLDEPTAGLAPRMVGGVFAKVKELAQSGVAVLMVEQSAKAALGISDRGYVLAEGRNRIEGAATDLLSDPEVGRIYLGGRR